MTTQEATTFDEGRIPLEPHTVHSQRLIEHAEEELAKGDRLQASEKAWGAVAHQLKVVADYRGWKYEGHAHVYRLIGNLAAEVDDPKDLLGLFESADVLHKNYYIDSIPIQKLEFRIDRIKELLEILKRPEFAGPSQ